MSEITMSVPDEALSALQMTPDQFGAELRLAGAVKLYEIGRRGSAGRRDSPDRLPHSVGRLRRRHVSVNGRGHAPGDALWLKSSVTPPPYNTFTK